MIVSQFLATHVRRVFFGGNWTSVNFKKQLEDISFEEANIKLKDLNTILALTYHIGYYITGVIEVFNDRPLTITDQYSYDHSKIETEADWKALYETILNDAERLAKHIEVLTDDHIWSDFVDSKYGNYFSNINGIIEHTHYHLGQISLIKKMIRS
ncbi:hypothetical protein [Psychroserpens sp. Hel_I_66]|uniref:hypothetical protein n=1 Tax=Psychroserpens sp. Hel_I_66 TaxID=1250004 RepID=UPI000645E388|nr:hypothetical protein [Psychroserpens sp. Hel_I_66]